MTDASQTISPLPLKSCFAWVVVNESGRIVEDAISHSRAHLELLLLPGERVVRV